MSNNEMVSAPQKPLETLEKENEPGTILAPSDAERYECKACNSTFSITTWGQCGGMCDSCGSPG